MTVAVQGPLLERRTWIFNVPNWVLSKVTVNGPVADWQLSDAAWRGYPIWRRCALQCRKFFTLLIHCKRLSIKGVRLGLLVS